MTDKILVEIYIPASGERFDVWIPLASKMSEVRRMVCIALNDLCKGQFVANADSVLCNEETGLIYDINMEVAELDIQNGTRLMLI